ncbi:MAG: four helix bundle protein [Calditrichaeota bacterium]|nr:four helix bundle protein [Calditrichota bacterium]
MNKATTREDSPDFLKPRTKRFALAMIRLCEGLPKGKTADVISRQLIRSSCSVAANHRASCRAKSKPDFLSKLAIVEEEIDECLCWLELLHESNQIPKDKFDAAYKEADEIISIVVASIKTMRSHSKTR